MPLLSKPSSQISADILAALRAKTALVRKRKKTPLEDELAAGGGSRRV